MKFLKGMGTGLFVGAWIGMAAIPEILPKKRRVGGAVRAVGKAIEDFGGTLKF